MTNSKSFAVEGDLPVDAAVITTASDRMTPTLSTMMRKHDCKMGSRSLEFDGPLAFLAPAVWW